MYLVLKLIQLWPFESIDSEKYDIILIKLNAEIARLVTDGWEVFNIEQCRVHGKDALFAISGYPSRSWPKKAKCSAGLW